MNANELDLNSVINMFVTHRLFANLNYLTDLFRTLGVEDR